MCNCARNGCDFWDEVCEVCGHIHNPTIARSEKCEHQASLDSKTKSEKGAR